MCIFEWEIVLGFHIPCRRPAAPPRAMINDSEAYAGARGGFRMCRRSVCLCRTRGPRVELCVGLDWWGPLYLCAHTREKRANEDASQEFCQRIC